MDINRARAALAAASLIVASLATGAYAQTDDHLKCFKIKDVATFKSATADLVPAQPQIPGENCTIKGKGAQLCVPVDKANVAIEEGTLQDFPTQTLQDAQLCYKVKCPSKVTVPVQVSDQFGTRTIQRGKASKVCGPAFVQ
jgi:hypothetical protein